MRSTNASRLLQGVLCLIASQCLAVAQLNPAFSCGSLSADTPMLRAGGRSEPVGEITVTCSGGGIPPGFVSVPTTDFELSLSAPYAGRITDTSGSWTESLLIVDDPTSPALGTNVYQATLAAPDRLRFANVKIDLPQTGLLRRRYIGRMRIVNIRVASPDSSGSPTSLSNQVLAEIQSTVQSIPFDNPRVVVGYAQSGLQFQLSDSTGNPVSALSFASPGSSAYRVRFDEGIEAAFRKRNIATSLANPAAVARQDEYGRNYGTESGFYAPGLGAVHGANLAGLASQGTRLMATFSNIPAGVTLSASVAQRPDSTASTVARLVQVDDTGTGSYSAAIPDSLGRSPLAIANGTARAVWEILDSNPNTIESIQFDIIATYSSTVSGAATASGQFAPVSANGTANATLPVPRFVPATPSTQSGCASDCLLVPAAISFVYTLGGAIPHAISFPIRSSGSPLSFRLTAVSGSSILGTTPPDGNWLSLAPSTGATPAMALVSVDPLALAPGLYAGLINVIAGHFSENVFVLLTVRQSPGVSSPLTCSVTTGVPPLVRQTGISEQVSDIVLNCAAPTFGISIVTSDIRLTLNTALTSRRMGALSDALLFVDYSAFGSLSPGSNVFRGEALGDNALLFRNIPIRRVPNFNTPLQITNVRADASRIDQSIASIPTPIRVSIRASAVSLTTPNDVVAFIQNGLDFKLLNAGGAQVSGLSISSAGTQQATLEFREGFPIAFRQRNVATSFLLPGALAAQNNPLAIYNRETGFYDPGLPSAGGLNTVGLATQGTRLLTRFTDVPRGVRMYVTVTETVSAAGSEKARLTQADANGAVPFQAAPPLSSALFGPGQPLGAEVLLQNGAGIAVWEVVGQPNIFGVDTLRFGLLVVSDGTASGTPGINGLLAPLSTAHTSDELSSVPRFSETLGQSPICTTCVHVPGSISLTSIARSAPLAVTSNNDPVIFTAFTQGDTWLRLDVGAGATPATLTVIADPTGLAAGAYAGSVSVHGTIVPVTFTVFPTADPEPEPRPFLSLSLDRIDLTFAQGTVIAPKTVLLDGTPGAPFQAVSNTPWLLVLPSAGTVPASLGISVNTGAVAPGEYLGRISVSSPGAGMQTLLVRVSATETPQFLPTPAAVQFVHNVGSALTPKVLYVTSRGRQTNFSVAASSTGNWLSVTPESGMTPVNLRVTYNPINMAPGAYTGSILITSNDGAGPPLSVPVSLEIR